ncbi:putative membrane protein [Chitinivorax tropicus]|uniref:Putative membrane protein n=1 Tax=Chitinivorax tropicus TaxID=714531 RepID=A0A840MKL5_9PROT|nr:phage holin family protein [Chitinivorax tropicus]MBB5017106.1 putative membrane protein [Chitinivorax tropicus]
MKPFAAWIVNTVCLLLVTQLVPGIYLDGWVRALMVALALGLLNTFVRPVLRLLTLPITLLTLGLFILVLNALLFWLVSYVIKGFHVAGFGAAFWGAMVYGVLSWLASVMLLGDGPRR